MRNTYPLFTNSAHKNTSFVKYNSFCNNNTKILAERSVKGDTVFSNLTPKKSHFSLFIEKKKGKNENKTKHPAIPDQLQLYYLI